MAKTDQLGVVIEKHIEKLVLALAGVILVVVLFKWVIVSPHQAQIGVSAVPVSPREIDKKLREAADGARQVIDKKTFKPLEVPPWEKLLLERMKRPFDPGSVAFGHLTGGEIPLNPIGSSNPFQEIGELEPIPPLRQIRAWGGGELVQMRASDTLVAKDIWATHVTAVLDYGTMIGNWRDEFTQRGMKLEVMFLRVTAERQERLEDGRWSEATSVVGATPPTGGRTQRAPLPEIPDPLPRDAQIVQAMLRPFRQVGVQESVIEPGYHKVYWSGPGSWGGWRHHLPSTEVNELKSAVVPQDQLPPGGSGRAIRRGGYPGAAPGMTPPGAMTPGLGLAPPTYNIPTAPQRERPQRRTARGTRRNTRGPSAMAPGLLPPGVGGPGGMQLPGGGLTRRSGTAGADKKRLAAANLIEQAQEHLAAGNVDKAINSFRAALRLSPNDTTARRGLEQAEQLSRQGDQTRVTAVPLLTDQCKAGIVQIWLHDTGCRPGKTYRYRLRLEMLNPLFDSMRWAEEPDNAPGLTLEAGSDWSAPVTVPPATTYFLVDGSKSTGKIKFEIYRTALGQWLGQEVSVRLGDTLGAAETRKLIYPGMRRETVEKEVDFATGCVVVDCDFDKSDPERVNRTTIEVTLLKPDGELIVRSLADDKGDQRRRLRARAEEAEDEIVQADTGRTEPRRAGNF